MAFANRINDLARTLAQYPTFVTVMGNKVDVRTKEQLATLSAETAKLEALAAEGDTAIANGTCTDPAGLSTRLDFNASQISSLLTAFAAQDTERLKSMSIISKQKFDAYAKNRLGAEKRYADEVSTLLKQEAKTVAGLGKSETGKPDAKPDTKPDSTPKPTPEKPTQPQPEPSIGTVADELPGYLRVTIGPAVDSYNDEQLAVESKTVAKAAVDLGAQTPQGILDYAIVYFTDGPATFDPKTGPKWAQEIIADKSLGTVDDRLAILLNASNAQQKNPDTQDIPSQETIPGQED